MVGLVCIGIGVPIWWRTTEVHRASLSHSEIEALPSTPLSSLVEMEIVVAASPDVVSRSKMALLGQRLKEKMEAPTETRSPTLSISYRGQVRSASDAELNVVTSMTDIAHLDERLQALRAPDDDVGKVLIYLLSSSLISFDQPRVGRFRAAFLPLSEGSDLTSYIPAIDKLARSVFVNEDAVFHAYHNARGTMRLKADKESMRALKSSVEYQMTFTLLHAQPREDRVVTWDIEDATKAYLQPLVDQLRPYVNVRVDSQVLYYVTLPMRPQYDAVNSRYFLTTADLPHIVNPIEAKLVSHVSSCPIMNFLVYVPPPEHSPLFIVDEAGDVVESNAFISARWGGMMIVNPPEFSQALLTKEDGAENEVLHDSGHHATVSLDMHAIMEVFLSQIRSLLHFDARPADPESVVADLLIDDPLDAALTEWEMDAWLRRRGLENIATSAATLKSLSDLLDKVQNIVINDEIGRQVETSLRACQRAMAALSKNRLSEAYVASKEALDNSEKAFFDPSLLEHLYFPDDQKFAIYMPLFLPIGLPIAASLLAAFKWVKTLKQAKDAKKTD